MSTDRIHYLLQQFFHQQSTPEEKEELALWVNTLQNDEEWRQHLSSIWNNYEPDEKIDPIKADLILGEILGRHKKKLQPAGDIQPHYTPLPARLMRWSVAAAAVIGICIVLSVIFFTENPAPKRVSGTHHLAGQRDIRPGGNKAVLTLAHGSKVLLDTAYNGSIAQQGNTKIIQVNGGLLTYEAKSDDALRSSGRRHEAQHSVSYNTLTTPRGGQYRLILPDGSKIWLNAASSIHFPTAFTGKDREVKVSGEAYFEIAPNPDMPFMVHIMSPDGQKEGTVKVLGTHFNINAYDDESVVRTTLLEGAVAILYKNRSMQLSPGEQAIMQGMDSIKVLKDINLSEAIAWKNGLFDFEGNDIQSVMRQIARWYNITVKYENATSAHFMGTISRSANISEVLKMLELTGAVHFKVEGRTITVLK
jgi:ferric-dicitrate binding protein FerR (iron transport regulator)